MTLATRVIPTLLCRGRTLVKGSQFNAWRSVGNVAQAVRVHAMRGVDELVLLDIGATPEGRGPDLALIEELAGVMTTPLAVGGGIQTIEHVTELLRHGADKVIIGQAVHHKSTLLSDCAKRFGSQAIVVAIDVGRDINGEQKVRGMGAGPKPRTWAQWLEDTGAGEILLTSMSHEGTMVGYDNDLIHRVANAVHIPVIAHGGCGTYQHMLEAIQAGAHAVAAGAMFQFTDQTPAGAARYLHEHGVTVRMPREEEQA